MASKRKPVPVPATESSPSVPVINPAVARLWRFAPGSPPQPIGNQLPELNELRAYVDGPVQSLSTMVDSIRVTLLMNEDGRARRLPFNHEASKFFASVYGIPVPARQPLPDAARLVGVVMVWLGDFY